jgi:DNA-binding response OmpR family regulator
MWRKTSYDIVFMDCQMPEKDGFAATEEIRGLERRRGSDGRTPIVALTANTMSGDQQKCFDAGMDDFVSKPIPFAALNRVLQQWVATTGGSGVAELVPGGAPTEEPAGERKGSGCAPPNSRGTRLDFGRRA